MDTLINFCSVNRGQDDSEGRLLLFCIYIHLGIHSYFVPGHGGVKISVYIKIKNKRADFVQIKEISFCFH